MNILGTGAETQYLPLFPDAEDHTSSREDPLLGRDHNPTLHLTRIGSQRSQFSKSLFERVRLRTPPWDGSDNHNIISIGCIFYVSEEVMNLC